LSKNNADLCFASQNIKKIPQGKDRHLPANLEKSERKSQPSARCNRKKMMNSTPPTVDDFLDESERGNSSSSFSASFPEAPVVVSSSVEMPTLNKKNVGRRANGIDETETSDSHGDGGIMLPPTSAASLPTPEDYSMDAGTYMNRKSSGGCGGRRRALIGATVCILCLALILGISLGATRNRGNDDDRYKRAADGSNTQRAPPSTRDEIVQWVTDAGLSSSSSVATTGTPQSKAIEYLLARQTAVPASTNLALSMEDNNAAYMYAAKYVLAVLFYATAGETSWITSLRFLQHDDICDWNAVHPAVDEFGESEMSMAGVGCNEKGLPVALDLGTYQSFFFPPISIHNTLMVPVLSLFLFHRQPTNDKHSSSSKIFIIQNSTRCLAHCQRNWGC
jgi:hypothetical protein